jgi:hypothetical protein
MLDEEGREYKVCEYAQCGAKFYRDVEPYNKLNDINWNAKKYCCKQHKRLAKNPFIKNKVKENAGS